MAGTLQVPSGTHFFPDPPLFKIWDWKLYPGKKGGGGAWYCEKRSVMKRSITFKLSSGPLNLVKNVTNQTHVKKVENTSEFWFGVFWSTWKTTIYQKSCWSGPIKNVRVLIFTVLYFFSKKKRKTPGDIIILHLCTKNLNIIYSSCDIHCDRLKLVIMDHFLPFSPFLKTEKIRILKKWKNVLDKSSWVRKSNHM